MSYHPNDKPSGLRWRPEGIELRCSSCLSWWPLTQQFWYFRQSFRRCSACYDTRKRMQDRARANRPEVRAARLAYAVEYRKDAREVKRIKAAQRYWADPEKARRKKREEYARNRARAA